VDFYEFYWAHLMRGNKLGHLWVWLLDLMKRPREETPLAVLGLRNWLFGLGSFFSFVGIALLASSLLRYWPASFVSPVTPAWLFTGFLFVLLIGLTLFGRRRNAFYIAALAGLWCLGLGAFWSLTPETKIGQHSNYYAPAPKAPGRLERGGYSPFLFEQGTFRLNADEDDCIEAKTQPAKPPLPLLDHCAYEGNSIFLQSKNPIRMTHGFFYVL
jgi:hypothetical protein